MKNSDFITLVVRCRNCIHRGAWECPMLQHHADIDGYCDMTDDEGFCHLGERDEETEEAEFRHNEYNNFLTSIMEDVYKKMNG